MTTGRTLRPSLPHPGYRPLVFWGIWQMCLATGARESEVLGLLWSDADEAARLLTVQHQLRRAKGKVAQINALKTGSKAVRSYALTPEIREALDAQRQQQQRDRERAAAQGLQYAENGLVFATKDGNPLVARNVLRAWKVLLKKVNLPPTARVHDLRHTSTSAFILANGPAAGSRFAGHASPAVTANVYTNVVNLTTAQAAEAHRQAIFGAPAAPQEG